MFKEPTWEVFCDESYYDMWMVRKIKNRSFGEGFHLVNGKEAKALCELLNKLEENQNE